MSSKVLSSQDSRAATPIAWGKLEFTPAASSNSNKPALNQAERQDERTAQLEASLMQLQQRYESDVAAAYRRGFSEGEANAKAGPAVEMEAVTQRLAQSVRDLAQLRPRLRRDAEADVVRLSLAIARRILHREMSVDSVAMQALAQVALQKLGRQEICRVYVHPDQAQAIKAALESGGIRAEVIPEITRESGALVFETNQGTLDASVNAQLEEIERGLTDRVNQS
jgi:flagellar assembly protein FliH